MMDTEKTGLWMSVLENSNFNGLGWAVTSILFYLSLYHFFLYIKNREKFYLFYSIYAFINAVNLIKRVKGVFVEDIYNAWPEFFIHVNFPIQFTSYLVFSFFIMEILNFRKHYPKFKAFFTKYAFIISLIFGVLVAGRYLWNGYDMMRGFYILVFMPITLLFTLYGIYLVVKIPVKVKYYILTGFLVLGIFTSLMAFLTFGKDVSFTNKYYYLFYIPVLVENFLYTFALAIKQREVYDEKISIQQDLYEQLEMNENLRSQLNEKLKEELVIKEEKIYSLEADAKEQRIGKLKADYEKEITLLHLQSLRNQMNPHFIFNALNSIKVYLIENDKENAVTYLNKFAKLIRMVLESSRMFSIPLGEELDIARLYVSLESIRFEKSIRFELIVGENIDLVNTKVPPLILQPFLENAIWHGLTTKKGEKSIVLKVMNTEGNLIVSIKDNGIGRKKSEELMVNKSIKKQSLGIRLNSERLRYFNESENVNYHFEILDHTVQSGQEGTEVVLYLDQAEV
ncbi:Putative regulator of cell autolysis [Aquiflexum balticum DSM 16537]|uniref:Putative regulator of cell autolysis n=1 Tax=Aquiflexum balticum DSM 16537 TaxID=758820 RepID=A0A1W2H5J2_9BACT|nr:histidine kinase [Aquiflexum balticum]SMD44227.1 Putative regulator of cell autolysis [Aquiflexum balticum DSM 16537]